MGCLTLPEEPHLEWAQQEVSQRYRGWLVFFSMNQTNQNNIEWQKLEGGSQTKIQRGVLFDLKEQVALICQESLCVRVLFVLR